MRQLSGLRLPNPKRLTAECAVLAEHSRGLNGGDILNIFLNAIHAGITDPDPDRWLVVQAMIEIEIRKARKAKVEHAGKRKGPERRIGFWPG